MSMFDFFKFKCRNCFKLFGIDQKCYNFNETHRQVIQTITGLKVPFIAGDESCAKICYECDKTIMDYTKLKARMTELQEGFINHFWQQPAAKEEPVPMRNLITENLNKSNGKPKDFQCSICQKGFTMRHTAARHIKVVHLKTQWFQCDLCPFDSGYKCNMFRHMRAVHKKHFHRH